MRVAAKPSDTMRRRIKALRAQIDDLDKRALAIERCPYRDPAMAVRSRVTAFLGSNREMSFGPREIMEAVAARDESVRKALTRLAKAEIVERVGQGHWRRKL